MRIEKMLHKFKQRDYSLRMIWMVAAGAVIMFCLAWWAILGNETPTRKDEVVHQQKVTPEADLNTVFITKYAYQKLGIQVAVVKPDAPTQVSTFGGEIMVPNGGKITLSAPVTGKLIPVGHSALVPGTAVRQGQLLFHIEPQLTPDTRANLLTAMADADGQVNTTQSQLEASQIALERARKLLQDLVGSQRNVDEANAAYEIALRNFEAANRKRDQLRQMVNAGNVARLDIRAPQSGVITNILALPQQVLTNGMPLVEISALDTLWVRVPVPSAALNDINPKSNARVSHLANAGGAYQTAKPVEAPPSADPLTGTVNLFYALPNQKTVYQPGQRVSVTLNAADNKPQTMPPTIVIPWSSIVMDVNGGSWVYLMISETEYKRQRVFVDYVVGSTAVLSDGLHEHVGASVVTNGALELFAVETGFTH